DLDRDGHPDLVVSNSGSGTVSVLMGVGDGTFGIESEYNVGVLPTDVAIGDLDQDGHLDLAVTVYGENSVAVLRGVGDGTFLARTTLRAGQGPVGVLITDLNLDGIPDVVTVDQFSNTISVMRATAGGVGDFPINVFPTRNVFNTIGNPTGAAVCDAN